MVATWSDSDPSSSESEPKMEMKANLCLMAIDDEVCIDDFDDFDKLQNEYECLFNDFEKLRHECKDYKKIITTLTLDIEKAKHEYDIVADNKNELEKCFDDIKSENEAFRLELEEKCKVLDNYLNKNATLKVSINEKEKHTNHMHANRHSRKKHAHTTYYECGSFTLYHHVPIVLVVLVVKEIRAHFSHLKVSIQYKITISPRSY